MEAGGVLRQLAQGVQLVAVPSAQGRVRHGVVLQLGQALLHLRQRRARPEAGGLEQGAGSACVRAPGPAWSCSAAQGPLHWGT